MHQQPIRYADAAEALATAAGAISAYSAALEDAQVMAARAGQLADAAEVATLRWQVVAAGGSSARVADPGDHDRQLAARINTGAHSDLAIAASTLVSMLGEAEHNAPRRPSLIHDVAADAWRYSAVVPAHLGIGFGKGAWGMAAGAYQLGTVSAEATNPLIWAIDPGGREHADRELGEIASDARDHPLAFAQAAGEAMVDWTEWSKDPAEALGEVLPAVLLTVATAGGAMAAQASTVAMAAEDAATVVEVGSGFTDSKAEAAVDVDEELPPLAISRQSAESKFKHADAFGVIEPRGSSGFMSFEKVIQSFLDEADTVRVRGTYRGAPAILSYNSETLHVIVQDPEGKFISGWRMTDRQYRNVLSRRSLGGG